MADDKNSIDKLINQLNEMETDSKLAEISQGAVIDAIKMLLKQARSDTGGSRRAASYLLSLWDGNTYRCDLQELLYVDSEVHYAFTMILDYLHKTNKQLDSLVTEDQMIPVINAWGHVFKTPQ